MDEFNDKGSVILLSFLIETLDEMDDKGSGILLSFLFETLKEFDGGFFS